MKGVLIVGVVALALIMFAVAVYCGVRAWLALRWLRALRAARWEPHTTVCRDGQVSVSVRKVARSGRRVEVLSVEDVAQVDASDPYCMELVEARGTAEAKAVAYNEIERSGAGCSRGRDR